VPAQRMGMDDALDHQWLSDLRSQRTESQQQGLGGDSMWSIESFDRDSSPAETREYLVDPRHRQATVSGTNGDSAIGDGDSQESFSQPMNNLRLGPPAHWRFDKSQDPKDDPPVALPVDGPDARPVESPQLRHERSSPPSPPLTENIQPGNTRHKPQTPLTGPLTPALSDDERALQQSANRKRKRTIPQNPDASVHPMFDSGSLSSVPQSDRDEDGRSSTPSHLPPIPHPADKAGRINTRAMGRMTQSTEPLDPTRIRQSPRTAKNRKSLRLG